MSLMTPKVSVVIASYNHADHVEACLRSVLTQDLQDFEIVVTDDGSSDGTADRVRAVQDPRISLEALPANRGACIAMNRAIRRARGRYIAVLNSDDVFLPGKLSLQAAYLDAHPEVGATFGWPAFIDERGQRFHDEAHKDHAVFKEGNRPRHAWLRHFFDKGNALCHPTAMIRREVYEAVGLYDPRLAQVPDLDMWMRVCSRFEIHVMQKPLTAFRILDGQRNASAARPEVVVRDAWERAMILRQYLRLPRAEIDRVFPEWAGRPESAAQLLAEHALTLDYPFFVRFALDALYDDLSADDAAPGLDPQAWRRFIGLTGRYDLHRLFPPRA